MTKREFIVPIISILYTLVLFCVVFTGGNKIHKTPELPVKEQVEDIAIRKLPPVISQPAITENKEQHKTVILKPRMTSSRGGYTYLSKSINVEIRSEIALLARLIQSESIAEPYEGKLAVGSVVLNRMKFYDKSMKDIIYTENQFSGVGGKLFNQEPTEECMQAAKEVLGGNKVEDIMYFLNLNKCDKPSWLKNVEFVERIGDHWFYKMKDKTIK